MGEPSKARRRALLAVGAAAIVGWVVGAPRLLSLGGPDLVFQDIPGLSPFRKLEGTGPPTRVNAAFIGLDAPTQTPSELARDIARVRADPCMAVFGAARTEPVPVAVFTDFNCPICRMMEGRLDELNAEAPESFRTVYHHLPLLGATSIIASRAVIAAGAQGAYTTMHARLLRTPAVTDADYVERLAQDIGLDMDRFRADVMSEATAQTLRTTKAVADVFGFYGTPAFAVGRTVFLGSVPKGTLRALIANEQGFTCASA